MRLDQNQYRIKIADMSVAEGQVYAAKFLAMDAGTTSGKVQGMATREPAFGTPRRLDRAGRPRPGRDVWLHGRRAGQASSPRTSPRRSARNADEILTRDSTQAPHRRAQADRAPWWSTN